MRKIFALIISVMAAGQMFASAGSNVAANETPAGDVTYYDRLSYGWYIYAGGNNIQYGPIPGPSKMVWAADGTVYIQDPLTANKMGTYIKGRKEGDKIVADFPQVLGEIEDNAGKRPLYIGVMKRVTDDRGDTYMPTEDNDRVTWTIHDDGKITMDHVEIPLTESGKFADMNNLPDDVLGTYYYGVDDYTGEYGAIWNAVGDWAQTYTPVQIEEITVIPEHLNKEVWRMTTRKDTRMVDVAFDGDVVYLGSLTQYVPGAIKGYIQGDKIYFPTTQYMGFNEQHNSNAWFISAIAEYIEMFGKQYLSKFIRTDALEFTYDAEKKTMTTAKNTCFLINASTTETNHFEYIEDPNLKYLPPEGMNANPKNPIVVNPGEDRGNDGLFFSVDIPAENVDGVALNTNNMFYNIYLNGELWEFNKDTYYYFNANHTDLPYSYSDKYDLQLHGTVHDIYFHEEGIRSISVQSCFRGSDGVLYKSELITVGEMPETADCDVEEFDPGVFEGDVTHTSIFTYVVDDAQNEPSGSGKKETYDVAIALTNSSLAGKAITKIEVPVLPTTKVGGLSVWVARELKTKLVDGKNVNIVNKRWEVDMPQSGEMQYVTVELDEPYLIPEGGLYVGYSLTVNEVDRSEGTQVPVVTMKTVKEGGFFLRTSRSFLSWEDRSKQLNVVAMTKVELAGDFHVNAAMLGQMPYSYLAVNQEQTVNIPVYNIGKTPISTLQYVSTAGDKSYEGSLTLDEPIPDVYAYSENIAFNVPVVEELGECDVTVKVTGVNGDPNDAIDQAVAEGRACVLKFVPKKLALVEEFTGTWCGWCPAGFVAMEKMNELYPDFVGIAYHDRDPMEMKGGYPNLPDGFPEAAISREFITHPYEATGMAGEFTMPQVWEYYCDGFVPVGISVDAELGSDNKVTVNSSVEWVLPAEDPDADYRVEYVLVADDLTGNTQGWAQHNYFSTEPVMLDYMEQFWHQDLYVRGLHYNDVAILTSGKRGVAGSITTTEPGVANEYTYVFDLTKAFNSDNEIIPFHDDKLRVVAFVLKGDGYGTVVNATKCAVRKSSGVSLSEVGNASPDAIYTISGMKLAPSAAAAPGHLKPGLYIVNGKKILR